METKFQCLVRRITYGSPVLTVLANGRDARRVMKARYPSPPEKPVVISVNPYSGLCDRLRGMCGVYQICKELGLEYKIAHFSPFNLYDFLLPNKVDWRIEKEDIEWDTRLVKILCWFPCGLVRLKKATDNDTHDFHFAQVKKILARVKNKRQVHVYACMQCVKYEDINGLFHELFKPTEELQKLVDWNKEQIGGQYISISTRFRNTLGDFEDCESVPASKEEQEFCIRKCLDEIDKLHKENGGMKVLVTSDSSTFIKEVSKKEYVYIIPGEIEHTNKCEKQDVHLKTFVDLLTISEAEKVYQITGGKMYKGLFSHTAACIGNKPYELVQF